LKIIDIHTHFFPENIAVNTVHHLEGLAGVKGYGDGTLSSLRKIMKEDGITIAVNAPVATKVEQVISINRKMVEHNSKPENSDVICLGAMHPLFHRSHDVGAEIEYLAKNGIKGIKLHTEYQCFKPDDGKLKKLYEACAKSGVFILFHAGVDLAYDADDVNGTPKRFAETLKVKGLKVILAHMGGYRLWDEVYRHLVGKEVYFDTAYSLEMGAEKMGNFIKSHGSSKVLFGSDFPWERPAAIRHMIEACVSGEADRENIFYKNSARLMGLYGE
jgi:uncharacterized protein